MMETQTQVSSKFWRGIRFALLPSLALWALLGYGVYIIVA
jgi:hypothetical protein